MARNFPARIKTLARWLPIPARLKGRRWPGVFRGVLDLPTENSTQGGTVEIAGWVFSLLAPITKIEAFLEDTYLGPVNYGLERPDVASANSWPTAAACGYAARLNLDFSLSGRKNLIIRATDGLGNRQEYRRAVVLKPPTARLNLDAPKPGATSGGVLPVEGWVYSPKAPVVQVQALLDGQFLAMLPYGIPRPEVESLLGQPPSTYSGFRGLLSFEAKKGASRSLIIRALTADGEIVERQVVIGPAGLNEPIAEIERASWQRGILEVEGYALWPESEFPRLLKVYINERLAGETRVNLSRPDIRQKFPTLPAAQRCGFRLVTPFNPLERELDSANLLKLEFSEGQGRRIERSLHLSYAAAPAESGLAGGFARILEEYQSQITEPPAILDWQTGLKLKEIFPEQLIFSPPLADSRPVLPYIAKSVEVVVLDRAEAAYLDEARRVATRAVVWPEDGAWKLEWQSEALAKVTPPSVSIIIPVYNKLNYTKACLKQLQKTLPTNFEGEIIVIDDCSTDETPQVLAQMAEQDNRLKILRNDTNAGFIDSCNRGAEVATGEILVFLNNDTLPQPGWLPPLLKTLREYPEAGAVGGKLIYPDGALQEAGSVIFADGSGCNFGRGDTEANAGLYSYFREVDYCSGALLATSRALFLELGGFDTRYRPAYYEDTDYCFKLREKGHKVYYQPESVVVHFEGVSSGRDVTRGVKSYQLVNQRKFVEKWGDVLKRQPAPPDRIDYENLHLWAVRVEKE